MCKSVCFRRSRGSRDAGGSRERGQFASEGAGAAAPLAARRRPAGARRRREVARARRVTRRRKASWPPARVTGGAAAGSSGSATAGSSADAGYGNGRSRRTGRGGHGLEDAVAADERIQDGFVYKVSQLQMQHDSIVGDPSPLRQIAGYRHNHLKSAKITGFCSSKSLVELTCFIMENATSLECFTLDTTLGTPRCSENKLGRCFPILQTDMIKESQKAFLAVREHIVGKVPPAVKLNVLGPCSLCHALELRGVDFKLP